MRRPLERREGLRHKEGGADCDLALSVSLILWDLIIMLGNLFRQIGDALRYPPLSSVGRPSIK